MRNKRNRLDQGLHGWIINYARKNFWRVASWIDFEDLVQDGFLCYCVCNVRYRQVKEQRHFMSLVKITFIRHVHDLANQRTRAIDEPLVLSPGQFEDYWGSLEAMLPSEPEESSFMTLVKQLPDELQKLIVTLQNDGKDLPILSRDDKRDHQGRFRVRRRETTNDFHCRLAGLDPQVHDIQAIFREHFL